MVCGLLVFDGTLVFSAPRAFSVPHDLIAPALRLLLVDLAVDPCVVARAALPAHVPRLLDVADVAVLAAAVVPAGEPDAAVVSEVEVAGENLAAADTLGTDYSAADKPVDAAAAAAAAGDEPWEAQPHQQPPAEPEEQPSWWPRSQLQFPSEAEAKPEAEARRPAHRGST